MTSTLQNPELTSLSCLTLTQSFSEHLLATSQCIQALFPLSGLSDSLQVIASTATRITRCWWSVSCPDDWPSVETSSYPLVPGNVRAGCQRGQALGCLLRPPNNVPTSLFSSSLTQGWKRKTSHANMENARIAGVSFSLSQSLLMPFWWCLGNRENLGAKK